MASITTSEAVFESIITVDIATWDFHGHDLRGKLTLQVSWDKYTHPDYILQTTKYLNSRHHGSDSCV